MHDESETNGFGLISLPEHRLIKPRLDVSVVRTYRRERSSFWGLYLDQKPDFRVSVALVFTYVANFHLNQTVRMALPRQLAETWVVCCVSSSSSLGYNGG